MKRFSLRALAVILLFALLLPLYATAETPAADKEATILFTHDLHDHMLPFANPDGGDWGGYARLATAIRQQRQQHPDALVLDAGDFSMGTLFQTIYSTHAPGLDLMGRMGYDVTTLGNHEFDYRAEGFGQMLTAAADHAAAPQIVVANYKPKADTPASVQKAMDAYGIKEYIMLERGGVRYAVFGIFGIDSDACAPMSGFELEDPIEAAKRVVAEIQAKESYDFLICLSHSGTNPNPKKSEDELLAKQVDGIDLILSGHTHTLLTDAIEVNGTYIASVGEYGTNLGAVTLSKSADGTKLVRYELIPINASLAESPAIKSSIEGYKALVSEDYLDDFGMAFDQVLTRSSFPLHTQTTHGELPLGNLIADSYLYAVQAAEGASYTPVDLAVVPDGVIRGGFGTGDITVSDAFNVSSLGYGGDGTPGYPLISVYLTGEELLDVLEIDASVAPLMGTAQLYFRGAEYTFNPNRMIFDKTVACNLVDATGKKAPIENDQLYRVVTGLYSAQMLGAVKGQSFGILSVEPKDSTGAPILDFEAHIIHTADGQEVKEWTALADYLASFGENGIPDAYGASQGRKRVEDSRNPIKLLAYPGLPTILALAVVALLLALLIFIICRIATRRTRRRRKSGYGYRRYRG